MSVEHFVWYFLPAFEARRDEPALGWWCFQTPEYTIDISMWPHNDPCLSDAVCTRSYKISQRGSGEIVFACETQFGTLAQAKIAALKELDERLWKSAGAVSIALRTAMVEKTQ